MTAGNTGEAWRFTTDVYRLPADSDWPRAVYVHVPFCRFRCGYCDFTLLAGHDDLVDAYLTALGHELEQLPQRCQVDTVYVGGGTPTHLTLSQTKRFLELVNQWFELSPQGEFTFEANPDGLCSEQLQLLRDYGVNRISLGVQSFDQRSLTSLERTHTPEQAMRAVQQAAAIHSGVSLDLIFGVPGQDTAAWQQTLETAVSLPITHISAYGLTFEKGTAFYSRRRRGELQACPDDVERAQYELAMDMLPQHGFPQYEISNYGAVDRESRHNHVYWSAEEYFAFGPGAARYVDGVRSTNSRNVRRWIQSWLEYKPILQTCERLSAEDRAREAVMLGLRRNCGIGERGFRQRFGWSIEELAAAALAEHLRGGLLEREIVAGAADEPECFLRLTQAGRCLADTVILDFL